MSRHSIVLTLIFCALFLTACGEDSDRLYDDDGPDRILSDLLEQGDLEGAESKLETLAAGAESDAWLAHWKGRIALARIERDPGDPAERKSGLDKAAAFFSKALDLASDDFESRVYLGKVLGMKGDYVKAVKHLENAIKLAPLRGDAYFELGRVYVRSGEVDAAISIVNEGLERDPERPDGHLLYGEIVFDYRSLYDEGLVAMREAMALDPEFPGLKKKLIDSLLYLAEKALTQDVNNGVLSIVSEILELSPQHSEALYLRAQVYARTDRLDEALVDLRQCIVKAPSYAPAQQLLARVLIKKGYQLLFLKQREQALDLFREAVALEAPDVDTTVVARILVEDAKTVADQQETQMDQAKSTQARTLFEEASALLERGLAEEALDRLHRSVQILPNNPFAHHQIGLALDLLKQPVEAEKELKLALSLAKSLEIDMPATYLKLAELAFKADRYDDAEQYLNEHAGQFPDQVSNPLAVGLRRRLLLRD